MLARIPLNLKNVRQYKCITMLRNTDQCAKRLYFTTPTSTFNRNIQCDKVFFQDKHNIWQRRDSYTLVQQRTIVIPKQRRVIGHKLEYIIGKHKRAKVNPPRVPMHPTKDVGKDMSYFETYQDLKLRWKKTTKSRKGRIRIARKWRQPKYINPCDPPTCMFILHDKLPQTRTVPSGPKFNDDEEPYIPGKIIMDTSHNFPVYPPPEIIEQQSKNPQPIFCIFKSSVMHQHKVTIGDLVQIERLQRKQAGDKVTFGTVLLVGSKDWTIIGKPTVPYAKVKATIQQQTLCGDQLSFRYRKSRRISRFLRVRHWVTIIQIDDIVLDTSVKDYDQMFQDDKTNLVPFRILDLWANRWLNRQELDALQEQTPSEEQEYKGPVHSTDFYNKLGLWESYRFHPDPYVKKQDD